MILWSTEEPLRKAFCQESHSRTELHTAYDKYVNSRNKQMKEAGSIPAKRDFVLAKYHH